MGFEKIEKAIRESLPELEAKELRGILEDYANVKSKLKGSRECVERLEKDLDKKREELKAHGELKLREVAVKTAEKEIEKRERDQQIFELKTQNEFRAEVIGELKSILHGLVRNTHYRKFFYGDVPVGVVPPEHYDPNNPYSSEKPAEPVTAHVSQDTTESAE